MDSQNIKYKCKYKQELSETLSVKWNKKQV